MAPSTRRSRATSPRATKLSSPRSSGRSSMSSERPTTCIRPSSPVRGPPWSRCRGACGCSTAGLIGTSRARHGSSLTWSTQHSGSERSSGACRPPTRPRRVLAARPRRASDRPAARAAHSPLEMPVLPAAELAHALLGVDRGADSSTAPQRAPVELARIVDLAGPVTAQESTSAPNVWPTASLPKATDGASTPARAVAQQGAALHQGRRRPSESERSSAGSAASGFLDDESSGSGFLNDERFAAHSGDV